MIQIQAAMICCICNTPFTLHTRVKSLETADEEVRGCPCPKCGSTSTIIAGPKECGDDEDPADAWKRG